MLLVDASEWASSRTEVGPATFVSGDSPPLAHSSAGASDGDDDGAVAGHRRGQHRRAYRAFPVGRDGQPGGRADLDGGVGADGEDGLVGE